MSKWFIIESDSEYAESLWGFRLVEADREQIGEYCKASLMQYVVDNGLVYDLEADMKFPCPLDDTGGRVAFYAQFRSHHTAIVAIPFDDVEVKGILSGTDIDKAIAEAKATYKEAVKGGAA